MRLKVNYFGSNTGEGVGTSNFTTMTWQKFQNVENGFLVHHYYDNQNVKKVFLVHHYYDNQNVKKNIKSQENYNFNVVIFSDAIGKIRMSKRFATKESFNIVIFSDAIGKIRMSKFSLIKEALINLKIHR
jgi:hypothetical protein